MIAPFSELEPGKVYKPNALLERHLENLSNGKGSLLPEMPAKLIAALLAGDRESSPEQPPLSLSERATPSAQPYSQTPARTGDKTPQEAEILACLDHIPADGYQVWLQVLSALKSYPNGETIARNWSAGSQKHTNRRFAAKWGQVEPLATRTLFTIAKTYGADLSTIARENMPQMTEAEIRQKQLAGIAAFENVVSINGEVAATTSAAGTAAEADDLPRLTPYLMAPNRHGQMTHYLETFTELLPKRLNLEDVKADFLQLMYFAKSRGRPKAAVEWLPVAAAQLP